ncbi:MAG: M48 family metallopeptidase [Clostridiaceae bacterium]|jgi:predicted metal-dependent hydrolase|nr:M48 family metallopeptidase [Clostridiaceae bacterium]
MQNYIEVENKKINYTVVRSSRKTIGISISLNYGVKVTAPKKVSDKKIAEVVNEKALWILEKLSYLENIRSEVPKLGFSDGEKLKVLGKEYTLKIIKTSLATTVFVSLSSNFLIVHLPQNIYVDVSELVKKHIVDWYKSYAKEVVSKRINFYAKIMGVIPNNLIVKDLKSIWGSCTSKNTININWKIIMAPLEIVDYLVVHELTHIKIKNHSTHFWEMAESILPDCKTYSNWLKRNGHKLTL